MPNSVCDAADTKVVVETLGTNQVYANQWMAVREDVIRRSDGSTGIYSVVESPDIALIIPAEGDRLHLVERYRYPVAGWRWEFPAGSATSRRLRSKRPWRWPHASCAKKRGSRPAD